MSLSDSIMNKLTGGNIRTIKVNASQLASIINDTFITKARTREEKDEIEKIVRGSKLLDRRLESADGRFCLFVSGFRRGTIFSGHRWAFVKNYETEEVFEWHGFSLGSFRRAVEPYLLNARTASSNFPNSSSNIYEKAPNEGPQKSNIGISNDPLDELEEMLAAGMITKEAYEQKAAALSKGRNTGKKVNATEQLKELQELLKEGLITQEDYDKKKQEVLDCM